jgi:aryl-alcohol dehydrogenase-like predicted oxidoreductase
MQYRQLGRSSLEVPVVTFGAWAIGGWNWGGVDDEQAVRAIQAGIDCGITAIDTAPVYGFGHSEEIVGRAIKGRRDKVVLMTKIGLVWDDNRGDLSFSTIDQNGVAREVRRNSRPWSIKGEVESSLQRMGVDVIDLIQVHRHDPKTPIRDTMAALLELRRAGKVREIGVSNYTAEMIQEAQRTLGDVPLASDQPKYSLLAREIEKDILPLCRREQIGTLVYSPLEQGLLSDKVPSERVFPPTDGRHNRPTFTPENRALVAALLRRVVQPIAERHRSTLAQIVITWTVAQPGVTSAIVGARTPEQARENAAAGDLKLSAAELAEIRAAFEALRLNLPHQPSRLKRFVKRLLGR